MTGAKIGPKCGADDRLSAYHILDTTPKNSMAMYIGIHTEWYLQGDYDPDLPYLLSCQDAMVPMPDRYLERIDTNFYIQWPDREGRKR